MGVNMKCRGCGKDNGHPGVDVPGLGWMHVACEMKRGESERYLYPFLDVEDVNKAWAREKINELVEQINDDGERVVIVVTPT
jgi:hypothetical protein